MNGSAIDTSQVSAPANRVVSGKVRTTSNQPAFITPNGAAASLIVAATTTNLVVAINGSSVTCSSDVTKSSLTTAPAANNTCLVDDADAADQESTRTWGERGAQKDYITVDTMGAEISALVGKFASFKINDGSNDEYFIAFVESTTKLSRCMRGAFYNSSLAPVNRIRFANNDTITLMSTAHLFLENNGTTVDVSYTYPIFDSVAPSSPVTGDYWYDFANSLWKRYDGASFVSINRTYIGMALINTANCVAARCVDFHKTYKPNNSLSVILATTSTVRGKYNRAEVSVAGNTFQWLNSHPVWNITTDLATSADMYNATEQASTPYYLYIKDTGARVISDISPYYRDDLFGMYHPHNPWRCVGSAYNSSGSDLLVAGDFDPFKPKPTKAYAKYTTNTTQAFANNTDVVVDFEDKVVDVFNNVTVGASWVFRAHKRMLVRVNAKGDLDSNGGWTATERVFLYCRQNSTQNVLQRWEAPATTTLVADFQGSVDLLLEPGDTVDVQINQNSGGSISATTPTGLKFYICIEEIQEFC